MTEGTRNSCSTGRLALALAALASLSACGEPASDPGSKTSQPTATPVAIDASPSPSTSPSGSIGPAPLAPEAEKGEKGARAVLLAWASNLENGRYAQSFELFGERGPANGQSAEDYAASFARCRRITIAMPTGTMEGAAGSVYYTAPTTLTCDLASGGSEEWTGDVVLRRVNDVPGATPEQLRWHIESADLKAGA